MGETKSQMQCPLCSSLNKRILRLIDVGLLIELWREAYQIDVRTEFRGVPRIELWRCEDCSLSFFAPEFLAGSAQLYSQLDRFDWYYRPKKWEYDIALEDMQGCKKVLEIGCGSGGFMLLGKEQLGLEIAGLEQNPRAIAALAARGLPVREATAEDVAKQLPGTYDAICSFQVLEHVPRPGEFLEACCTLLQPGGKLMLGLPNADSFLRHQFNSLDMPPHHMSRRNRDVLVRIPSFFPLKLVRTANEPLTDYQLPEYVDAYTGFLARYHLRILTHPGIRSRLGRLIRWSGVQKFLTGQSFYACYVRT